MNASPILVVDEVRHAIESLLAEYPELADDDTLRADMIEGETRAFDLLDRLVSEAQDAAALSAGIKGLLESLGKRKAAAERREEAMRALALRIMEAAKLDKVVLPRGTLFTRRLAPTVRLLDEKLIPDEFWRVKREVDKAALKAALQNANGFPIPGAELTNGGVGLTIRIA